ncbi:MAG: TIGR02147 family protein [Oligoflexia bacterium]|nr:TIGR02147 family protein [Oligoflexia bacterium]
MITKAPVRVFDYEDYRSFLKDAYMKLKSAPGGFSFRAFSRAAGFTSPNFIKLVMDGQRNLSQLSIERCAQSLAMTGEETQFFRHLVLFCQATTSGEKQFHAEQLLRSKSYRNIHPLREQQFNYFRHWYFVAIRELVGLKGFQEDPNWIAKRVQPNIAPADAKKALDELIELGLIGRDPSTGKLFQTHQNIATQDEVTSASIAQFHKEMLQKAGESIDRFTRDKREISSVTVGISARTAKTVKEMVQRFRKEVMEVMAQDPSPTVVYQLNFQLFPLTDDAEDGDLKQ